MQTPMQPLMYTLLCAGLVVPWFFTQPEPAGKLGPPRPHVYRIRVNATLARRPPERTRAASEGDSSPMIAHPLKPPPLQRKFTSLPTLLCLVGLAIAPTSAVFGRGQARDTALHVAVVFGILLCVFRLIGKRELSRLSPFEFVTLMLVPELVSGVVQGDGELSPALVGLSTLFFLVLLTSTLSHRSETFQALVEPRPTILVANGRMLERAMNDERIAPEELVSEMHKNGLEDVRQVKWAILESGGHITVVSFDKGGERGSTEDDDVE